MAPKQEGLREEFGGGKHSLPYGQEAEGEGRVVGDLLFQLTLPVTHF